MQYIHLNDDSYILHTAGKGMTTLTRKSFNFHTIKRLVGDGVEEDQILPLLEPPKLPDGLFELYLYEYHDGPVLTVKRTKPDGAINWTPFGGGGKLHPSEDGSEYLGMYASEIDMISDWPEFCL